MKRYRLAGPAKADLDEIWLYIAQEGGVAAADRVIATINARFLILGGIPDAGRACDEIGPNIRAFPVGKYLIYYRPAHRGGILISRVIHGMRDQQEAWRSDHALPS
jgi:toxin ParE1/3/4